MGCYTISDSVLKNAIDDTRYLHGILFEFSNPDKREYKFALDSIDNKILSTYEEIAKTNQHISTWLDLMSKAPSCMEFIRIETNCFESMEEVFIAVCSATNCDKKLIISSHQEWGKFKYIDNSTRIAYNNCEIEVLDQDEAIEEFKQKSNNMTNNYTINNSGDNNNIGNNENSGNSGISGNTGNSGNIGNTGHTGNTGNTDNVGYANHEHNGDNSSKGKKESSSWLGKIIKLIFGD